MPFIRIIDGTGVGTVAEIVGGKLTLGREADNGLVVEDPKSSRNHCEVVREGDSWQLHDLGSSNGTWTDAGRIESLALSDGSTFRIGRTYLRFELGEDPEQTHFELGGSIWLDPSQIEGLKHGTDLFHQSLGGTTTQLARHNTYLVLLHQLVERSRAARSRDELFGLLDDAAAEVLDGDRCAVFLPTDEAWELWPPHERMLRARYGAVPFARTLLRAVRRHQEPLLCTLLGDLNPSQSMLQAGVRSAMAAPLRIGDELHATLYVDRIKGVAPFTRADLEFLSAVANQLAVCLTNLATVARMSAEISRLSTVPEAKPLRLIGQTLVETEALATRVAASAEPCLIMGESGTGKDLLARIIHQRSPRASRPLQILACGGIAPDKLDATLLGSVADARPGLLELADQATLLIDEVADLPPESQARLVRFLDTGEIVRLGDQSIRRADVRVIATSSRDLRHTSNDGRLRADLLARLSALSFALPRLVDRAGDLDALIEHFLSDIAVRLAQPPKRLAPAARTVLLRAAWPGNVGQLKLALDRACITSADHVIQAADLPDSLQPALLATGAPGAGSWPIGSLSAIERLHIIKVLDHCGGNKKAASEVLEIDRSTLYAKLRQYGLA
jgi:DNA-binding NtrC family response regulator